MLRVWTVKQDDVMQWDDSRFPDAVSAALELYRVSAAADKPYDHAVVGTVLASMFTAMQQHDRALGFVRQTLLYYLEQEHGPLVDMEAYREVATLFHYSREACHKGPFRAVGDASQPVCKWRICARCDKVGATYEKCSGCLRAWYCSVDCQRADWPTHKTRCNYCVICKKTFAATALGARCTECGKKHCSTECILNTNHTCASLEKPARPQYANCASCLKVARVQPVDCKCREGRHTVCDDVCARLHIAAMFWATVTTL